MGSPTAVIGTEPEKVQTTSGPKEGGRWKLYHPDPSKPSTMNFRLSFEEEMWQGLTVLGEYRPAWLIADDYAAFIIQPEEATPPAEEEQAKQGCWIAYFKPPAALPLTIANFTITNFICNNPVVSLQNLTLPIVFLSHATASRRLPASLEQRLNQLKQLPDGWDGYGAPPISPKTIQKTRSILLQLISHEELGLPVPLPFVSPTLGGGVGLEWKLESGKELLLEVSPAGDMSYLLVVPKPEGGEEETEDVVKGSQELESLFQIISE